MVEYKTEIEKHEKDRTMDEDEETLHNLRALNAIYNGVDLNIFKIINTYTSAKEAWETLEITYEGTSMVRMSRL